MRKPPHDIQNWSKDSKKHPLYKEGYTKGTKKLIQVQHLLKLIYEPQPVGSTLGCAYHSVGSSPESWF